MSGRDGGRRKGPAELEEAGSPQRLRTRRKPEVMSPAGHWPELQAAVEAGADAVYFGLRHFSARAKVGFAAGELAGIMRFLHRRGVKGYVTFNTLVFDREGWLVRRARHQDHCGVGYFWIGSRIKRECYRTFFRYL